MPRALAIDDDPIILKLTTSTLTRLGYDVVTAADGLKGLAAVKAERPDIIITDVMMPGLNGYEVTRRLRRDPEFSQTPILVLTGQAELEEKLLAFEAGADDYMNKPFEPAELAARLSALLRRAEAGKAAQALGLAQAENARLIAVHSLRGGVGCSSLAVNLAISLTQLWDAPTVLIDLVFNAGQIALMLDTPLKRTWADLAHVPPAEIDREILATVVGRHASGLDFIAAPTLPSDAEAVTSEALAAALGVLRSSYAYAVVDTPHDFGDTTLAVLDAADVIVLLMAPEMASVRAAAAAVDTYGKLGYARDKIRLVMNWTFERHGLVRQRVESALHMPIALTVPYAPDKIVGAINRGRPVLYEHPADSLFAPIEDFAFQLSQDQHQAVPPAVPSAAWQRVNKRASTAAARK